jgi:hypothetical protein
LVKAQQRVEIGSRVALAPLARRDRLLEATDGVVAGHAVCVVVRLEEEKVDFGRCLFALLLLRALGQLNARFARRSRAARFGFVFVVLVVRCR